jgi:spoIIIJ-associated protein
VDWVETTGKTVEEASQRALSHLGVAHADADIEVLEEPQKGLFGRMRGEARVRARVRPSGPPPKRARRGRTSSGHRGESSGARPERREPQDAPAAERATRSKTERPAPSSNGQGARRPKVEEEMAEGITLAEQGELAKGFLVGLLEAMDLTASVSIREVDDETVEVLVDATPPTELGILVGPRGTTLQALQEVTRTVVQAKSPSRTDRILVDVAHYRERRVAALARFADQVAADVLSSNEERALEPMSAADRKAIHDALTEREGVVTRSEGEEPRRFVVVAPA